MPDSTSSPSSPTWAVCAIVKEPYEVIERYVRHYQKAGAAEIIIFFHRPDDPAMAWAREQERVTCYPMTADFLQEVGGPYPFFPHLQLVLFEWTLRNHRQHRWIAHFDADELVAGPLPLASYLAEVEDHVAVVRLLPLEAVWSKHVEPTRFQQDYARLKAPILQPWARKLMRQVYGHEIDYLDSGLAGHTLGKIVVRVAQANAVSITVHQAETPTPLRCCVPPAHSLGILHYDTSSYEHFVQKFGSRMGTFEGKKAKGFRGKIYDRFLHLYETQDEAGLKELFAKLYILDDRQIELLAARNLILPLDSSSNQLLHKPFSALEVRSDREGDQAYFEKIGYQTAVLETTGNGTEVRNISTPDASPKTLAQALSSYVDEHDPPTLVSINTGPTTPDFLDSFQACGLKPRYLATKVHQREQLAALRDLGYRAFLLVDLGEAQQAPTGLRILRLDGEFAWHRFPSHSVGPFLSSTYDNWLSYSDLLQQWEILPPTERERLSLYATQIDSKLLTGAPERKNPNKKKTPFPYNLLPRPPRALLINTSEEPVAVELLQFFPAAHLYGVEPDQAGVNRLQAQLPPSHSRIHLFASQLTETLDGFCQQQQLSKIDCLVLHTPASPIPALQGSSTLLQTQRPRVISLKFGCTDESTAQEHLHQSWSLLAEHGYRLYQADTQNSTAALSSLRATFYLPKTPSAPSG